MKVTPEGKVKILDFGLAKAFEGETPVADISQSPTLTEEMTKARLILGTAAYMSPEQAKGKPVDKRADIFAFGAVLYELLTAKRAFEGETITETLAKILEGEPKWEALPVNIPESICSLLRRCLTKDPHDRLERELLDLIDEEKIGWEKVCELGEILIGKHPGRVNDEQLIYYKNNTGLGIQFAAAGEVIYEACKKGGLGREVPTEWFGADLSEWLDRGFSPSP